MKKSSVSEWNKLFKESCKNVEDDKRSGCPRSHRNNENIEKMWNLVHSDRHLSINQAYYVEILKQLHKAVCRKRLELWPDNWILHHDNVQAHKALSTKQFLAQKLITVMEHPSYSPDLAPNNF
jgi:hypothetical protein